MRKILALVIVLAGVGGGLALGMMLRPDQAATGAQVDRPATAAASHDGGAGQDSPGEGGHAGADAGDGHDLSAGAASDVSLERNYVKVGRQIIIPIVEAGETRALMLFDLAIDVPFSMTERAYSAEPRLRDAFLRVMFEMSYTGAFSSTYTDERVVDELRTKLRAAARRLLGDEVSEVLILDIIRQEL